MSASLLLLLTIMCNLRSHPCYATITFDCSSNLDCLKLEAIEHNLEVTGIDGIKLSIGSLLFNHIRFTLMDSGIHLDPFGCSIKLVGCNRGGPAFSANSRTRCRSGCGVTRV